MDAFITPKENNSSSTFPAKLHKILDSIEQEKSHADIISWLPGGKSFKVHRKEEFVNTFLPAFSNASKFKSFQRNLNLWNFHTVSKGPDKGVCSHPHFIQGKPELIQQMKRVSVKGTRVRRPSSQIPPHVQNDNAEEVATDLPVASSKEKVDTAHRPLPTLHASPNTVFAQSAPPFMSSLNDPSHQPPVASVQEELVWRAALSQATQEILSARLLLGKLPTGIAHPPLPGQLGMHQHPDAQFPLKGLLLAASLGDPSKMNSQTPDSQTPSSNVLSSLLAASHAGR
eukprot:Nitzschia sp. Nitz4//NODE_540_length_12935_cov_73.125932//8476//9330//NITZ4_additional_000078-RA//1//CDS//3329531963//2//frame0